MTFEPVWVSSVDHLDTFEEAYRRTPLHRRLFGAYSVPDGFPSLRGWMFIPWNTPLLMFASGRLDVDGDAITFGTRPWRLPMNVLRNLASDLQFNVRTGDIETVERFKFASPFMRYFDTTFVRIHTNKAGVLSDFLLCTGGVGGPFTAKGRQRNEKLIASVMQALSGSENTSDDSSPA